MSLLPGQILPQSAILGRVKEDGTVTIEQNWWLLLYNLCLQTLGTGSGLPADALIDLESADTDAIDADAIALRAPLSNALLLAQQLEDLGAEVAKLQKDVSNAIELALTNGLDDVPLPVVGSFTIANPSGTVGLTAVNGSTGHVMDAGSAPPLSQAIAPTWTSAHVFQGANAAISLNGQALSRQYITFTNTGGSGAVGVESSTGGAIFSGTTAYATSIGTVNATDFFLCSSDAARVKIAAGGAVTVIGALGVNGATPPAQSTGWGTPTSPSVVSNFSGSAATTAQIQAALAEVITVLKAVGILGA